MNDIQKWQVEQLASNGGYSDRYIASYVFNVQLGRVKDEQLAAVQYCRKKREIKLTDWRNGKTPLSQAHARTSAKSYGKQKRKRA